MIIWINMEYYGNMVINGDHHLSIGYGSIPIFSDFSEIHGVFRSFPPLLGQRMSASQVLSQPVYLLGGLQTFALSRSTPQLPSVELT